MNTAQNNTGTATVIGRPFRPGQSGNPGGRPKGIAKTVREACGGDPTKLITALLAIAQGQGADGKPARPADQIRACEIVLAYGWGKPPAHVPVEGADPLELDEVSVAIQQIADELEARRRAATAKAQ